MKLGGCLVGYDPEGNLFEWKLRNWEGGRMKKEKKKKIFGDGREEKRGRKTFSA